MFLFFFINSCKQHIIFTRFLFSLLSNFFISSSFLPWFFRHSNSASAYVQDRTRHFEYWNSTQIWLKLTWPWQSKTLTYSKYVCSNICQQSVSFWKLNLRSFPETICQIYKGKITLRSVAKIAITITMAILAWKYLKSIFCQYRVCKQYKITHFFVCEWFDLLFYLIEKKFTMHLTNLQLDVMKK